MTPQLLNLSNGTLTGTPGMADTNGNYISATTNGNSTTYTDTLGTAALTVSSSSGWSVSYQYTNPSNTLSSFTVSYTTQSVSTAFGCTGPTIPEWSGTATLVYRITLPDGTFYEFGYDGVGRLNSITLPTGGTIQYQYTGGSNGSGIECVDGSTATLTRTLGGTGVTAGTWTYTRSGTIPSASVTTVKDPASPSNQTVIDFYGDYAGDYYETSRTINQGSGSALEVVSTCYNPTCQTTNISVPITQRTVQTTLEGANGPLTRSVVTNYESHGLPTSVLEYGYSNNLLRKTVTQYASLGNYISDRPSEVQVYLEPGGEALNSQTAYAYDQYALQQTSAPQHNDPSGSRGNPTTITYYSTSGGGLAKTLTYYDTGNLYQATDVNNAVTTYTYGACGDSFLTSVSLPMSLSRSMTWDANCNGGVETSLTDENGRTTYFCYYQTGSCTSNPDPNFWRLMSVVDPTGATTNFSYCTSGCTNGFSAVESTLAFNSNNSVYDVRSAVDGFGRVHLTQRKSGPNLSTYVRWRRTTTTWDG